MWKLWCGFLFAFHSNYGSILHRLRDKARYWSTMSLFSYLLAFDVSVMRVPVGILSWRLAWRTRIVWLPDSDKNLKICLFVSIKSTNVTDGQTDGRTDGRRRTDGRTDTAWRLRPPCIASRGKNWIVLRERKPPPRRLTSTKRKPAFESGF